MAVAQKTEALRQFIEAAPLGVAMFDREMRYIAASARWRADYRLGAASLAGRSHYDVFPELPESWKDVHRRCLAGATEHSVEDSFVRADGSRQWLRWLVQPWRTESEDIGGLIMFYEDITASKEAALALRASESTLRAALESMSDAVFISDRDGRFIAFNEAFAAFHKFPDKAACAKTLREYPSFLEVILPNGETAPLDQWAVPRALRGETGVNVEYGLRRSDTGESWIGSYNFAPIRDEDGRITGAVVVGRDVTAQKAAERASKESEARLRLALDASAAGIWNWDLRTGLIEGDARSCALLGFGGAARIPCETLAERLDAHDREQVLDRLRDLKAPHGKDAWDSEFLVHDSDTTSVWVHVIGRAERDEAGHASRVTGIALDVTARKRAELMLQDIRDEQRENAETMRLLLESASQGILSLNRDGVIETANAAIDRMFGWPRGTLVGQRIDVLIPTPLRAAHNRHYAAYWGSPHDRPMGIGMDLLGQRRDGSTFPIEVSLNHVPNATGGRAMAFVTDISERVRSMAAVRESEERLHLALDAAAAGAWTWDLETDRVDADARICARLGTPPGESFPFDRFLTRVHPDERDGVNRQIDAVRAPWGSDIWNVEYRLQRADEGCVWHQSLGHVERDADGRALRVSGISLDVTARKESEFALTRAHRALEERAAELERRTAQLSQLASDLTLAEQHAREELSRTLHDHLQQLLFSSRLTLDRVAKRIVDRSVSGTDLVDRARHDVDEAIAVTRSLSVELSPPMLHESGLPAALAWLIRSLEQKYGLTVETRVDPRADPARRDIRILAFGAIRELLFNVVKHAGTDHAVLDVTLTPADMISITVADRGVGFDVAAVLDAPRPGLTGLGLFSIRERLLLFGGRLDVQSTPGHGARFVIVVPKGTADAAGTSRRYVQSTA